jgi:hypothetical protein
MLLGAIDFLNIVSTQALLLQSENDLADSDTRIVVNLVNLYRALGGRMGGRPCRQLCASRAATKDWNTIERRPNRLRATVIVKGEDVEMLARPSLGASSRVFLAVLLFRKELR